ncbi:exosortase F system-associated membrane protein [Flavobacterium undicola]|uniref:exosortase F system-associated membrane protein n=1 Tax=Flavobacterium undicola TaxID=1932779 RepID=UPI00137687EF|nr:exosortase F system-associated protein [Flavobacterium undicola]MBA0884464.1 exosortase F system-associated protein [Flavobacterium undicola]
MLNKILKLVFALGLVFCLVLVRYYENVLFYDPFLDYFKGDFNQMPLPEFDVFRLILNLLFRYGLNMIISLGLIYVIFKDYMMIQFSFFLYLVAFFVLLILFFLVINYYGSDNNFLLFYVRRFLIQPIFVLLFIPAFYFQKRHS